MIRYQLGSGIIDTVFPGMDYENAYRRDCTSAETFTPNTAAGFAYVGVWRVKLQMPDGTIRFSHWRDTLGIYNSEDVAVQNQSNEAASRIPLMSAFYAQKGSTLLEATLVKVSRLPVPRNAVTE
jgi:hypothetical protein